MGSAARLDLETALVVFAQASDARVDIAVWSAHAVRFFACRLGLTEERRYGDAAAPNRDALSFVVAPIGEPPGIVAAAARPRSDGDLAAADAVELRAGAAGLGLLARRCNMVWVVAREPPTERLSFRLAAVLASVLLGPILDSRAGELFGVKTARSKLESAALSR